MKLFPLFSQRHRACAGMTLVEAVISVALGTVIIGVALMLLYFGNQALYGLTNYDQMNRSSRNALDVMSKDIRTAKWLTGYISNGTVQQLTFSNLSGYTPSTFSYSYTNMTGSNGALTRNYNGFNTVLLTNLSWLTFGLCQRSPNTNLTFYPTTDPNNTKLITLSWQSRSTVGGARFVNTETVHSANIVIRNHS
jgi:Tfp pilus assembly protein PilW